MYFTSEHFLKKNNSMESGEILLWDSTLALTMTSSKHLGKT